MNINRVAILSKTTYKNVLSKTTNIRMASYGYNTTNINKILIQGTRSYNKHLWLVASLFEYLQKLLQSTLRFVCRVSNKCNKSK